jgi:hypothetical protein
MQTSKAERAVFSFLQSRLGGVFLDADFRVPDFNTVVNQRAKIGFPCDRADNCSCPRRHKLNFVGTACNIVFFLGIFRHFRHSDFPCSARLFNKNRAADYFNRNKRRKSDKPEHEFIAQLAVNSQWSVDLFNAATSHNQHSIRKRHRFIWGVRNINDGKAEFVLQCLDFKTHFFPQVRVKIGKRLVQKHNFRIDGNSVRKGKTLLSAGKFSWIQFGFKCKTHRFQHYLHPLTDFRLRNFLILSGKATFSHTVKCG